MKRYRADKGPECWKPLNFETIQNRGSVFPVPQVPADRFQPQRTQKPTDASQLGGIENGVQPYLTEPNMKLRQEH